MIPEAGLNPGWYEAVGDLNAALVQAGGAALRASAALWALLEAMPDEVMSVEASAALLGAFLPDYATAYYELRASHPDWGWLDALVVLEKDWRRRK